MNPELVVMPFVVALVVPVAGRWIEGRRHTKMALAAQNDPDAREERLPCPGQSLREQLRPLLFSLKSRKVQAMAMPFLAAAACLVAYGIDPGPLDATIALLMVLPVLMIEGYLVISCLQVRRRYRRVMSAYQAKQVTARALTVFERDGDFVCHEFSRDDTHIDHILVGSKGIFAIQTHAGGVDPNGGGDKIHLATYDGRKIFLPRGDDGGTLSSAMASEQWLSDWLSEGLKSPVAPRAIVSMPGWRVKRTSAEGIPVVNPAQFDSLFAHIPARPLSSGQIEAIIRMIKTTYHPNPA